MQRPYTEHTRNGERREGGWNKRRVSNPRNTCQSLWTEKQAVADDHPVGRVVVVADSVPTGLQTKDKFGQHMIPIADHV